MKKMDWRKYAPPGIPWERERNTWIIGLVMAGLLSFVFLARYMDCYEELFYVDNGKRVLIEGAMMLPFSVLLGNSLTGFWILAGGMLTLIFYHYRYHWQESRIHYLMRRLPQPWYWHTRCFILPVAMAVTTLVISGLVMLIYYLIYLLATPSACMPNHIL